MTFPSPSLVHIIRHGQSLHNVDHGHVHPDPPLTQAGAQATTKLILPVNPDLIIISPMTRTVQTAINMFPYLSETGRPSVPVQIWPDLREAHDAICNKGVSRAELQTKYPQFDFAECHEEWDYAPHTVEGATARAERVRSRLQELSSTHKNIAVITHRGFIAYLVQGPRFQPSETRMYQYATKEESLKDGLRKGVHCESMDDVDFGPTLLLPYEGLHADTG
jgi:broad specificity phosphatase PhoE